MTRGLQRRCVRIRAQIVFKTGLLLFLGSIQHRLVIRVPCRLLLSREVELRAEISEKSRLTSEALLAARLGCQSREGPSEAAMPAVSVPPIREAAGAGLPRRRLRLAPS